MPALRKWTDEQLILAVAESQSMCEVHRRLGIRAAGSSWTYVSRHIERLGLSTSHFKGQGWSRGSSKRPDEVAATLLPLLRKGTRITNLRDRLITAGLKQAKCEVCGIMKWCGKSAPLQVEHTDGDHFNNLISNLRILCANCHMQTETWGFKGARRRPDRALMA